jgi:hypothetical protein
MLGKVEFLHQSVRVKHDIDAIKTDPSVTEICLAAASGKNVCHENRRRLECDV